MAIGLFREGAIVLVFPELRVALITPPKNGSSSLHLALTDHKLNTRAIWIEGPFPNAIGPPMISRHSTYLPEEFEGYLRAVVIRNPYDRAASLYRHWQGFQMFAGSFDDFVAEILPYPQLSPFAQAQAAYTEEAKVFLRLETIENDLRILGIDFGESIPKLNSLRDENEKAPELSPYALGLLNFWAIEDFRKFGYQKIGRTEPLNSAALYPAFKNWKGLGK